MRGRPRAVKREDEGLFSDMWLNPEIRVVAIMATFNMSECVVHTTATRLGLPDRAAIRQAAGFTRHGPLVAHMPKAARTPRPKLRPSGIWRCTCGGIADTPEGHPRCQVAA